MPPLIVIHDDTTVTFAQASPDHTSPATYDAPISSHPIVTYHEEKFHLRERRSCHMAILLTQMTWCIQIWWRYCIVTWWGYEELMKIDNDVIK